MDKHYQTNNDEDSEDGEEYVPSGVIDGIHDLKEENFADKDDVLDAFSSD